MEVAGVQLSVMVIIVSCSGESSSFVLTTQSCHFMALQSTFMPATMSGVLATLDMFVYSQY